MLEGGRGRGLLAAVLPPLAGVGFLAFAFVGGNPLFLVVGVLVVALMVGGTVGAQVASRRRGQRQAAAVRDRWLLAARTAAQSSEDAARQELDALEGLHPDPTVLARLADTREGLWERRPGDPDFLVARVGVGPVPAPRPVLVDGLDRVAVERVPDRACCGWPPRCRRRRRC